MASIEQLFHETWLGLVQPTEGLVVSVPVLVDAQCMERSAPALQHSLHALAPEDGDGHRSVLDLEAFFEAILGLAVRDFDTGSKLPDELSLWVSEGQQLLRPALALRNPYYVPEPDAAALDDSTPASRAGKPYVMLVGDLPDGLAFDRAETVTGEWHYPPAQKFDRLLRACQVPIGLLTNRRAFRLFYAPHGATTGSITFHVDAMAAVGGRAILDAFVMLLSAQRFFGVADVHQLPALLRESRNRQVDVTESLAEQVFEAIHVLLDGFEAAAARDGSAWLDEALAGGPDHTYGGLLTVLLRLVFLLYAEDRGLMPVRSKFYAEHLSVLGLFEQLQDDAGAHPDTMNRRFGAWPRLLALFRAVFTGMAHPEFKTPARRGKLFNPETYPFLEGRLRVGGAPISHAEERATVRTPAIDDGTVAHVLRSLLLLGGQRLAYKALDVEQIGSVYERLMGYHVVRLTEPAVCVGPNHTWLSVGDVLEVGRTLRAGFVAEETGLSKDRAQRLVAALEAASDDGARRAALETEKVRFTATARVGKLVIQPGEERRRTSSHYTPRTLSSPIVRRALEPLLSVLAQGRQGPSSAHLLELKVCDPAMGSGAFLVEACRLLGDQLVAAWTREGVLAEVCPAHLDPVVYARRLVAQRCLYGVDKNPFAVDLARLSMWLVTLAEDEPFTFVDHALRHGDSLVGLSLKQLRGFHWEPTKQYALFAKELKETVDEALSLRQQILELAGARGNQATRDKEWLLQNAEDALERARLIGDLVVGAFFAHDKKKAREDELKRRQELVEAWLAEGLSAPPPAELLELQRQAREQVPAFHWMLELPEVFYASRPDPLERDVVNDAAWMDAFVGNPPFAGKNSITGSGGPNYLNWLQAVFVGSHGNADLSAYFFLRAADLLGKHGTIGLIATNTIAQGDTRDTGLKALVGRGFQLYDAIESLSWPGEAAVTVSTVHLAVGTPAEGLRCRLGGRGVEALNSRLRPKPERPDPVVLRANAGKSFVGSYVLGMGFTLTPEERDALVAKDARNAERIFPYLGGKEVNTSPTQEFERYVINFGKMSLEEAERWPDLIGIVREKVKPERDRQNREVRRKYWWRFGEAAPALYEAIAPLERCLVTARVSKHLMMSFQPTDRVFSEQLYVFAIDRFAHFALLQSATHGAWAWLLSSSMKTDLRYTASSCFETFPFPSPSTLAAGSALDAVGRELYEARAAFMVETSQGLTTTYNLLKDPSCDDARVVALRELHESMDRAVLEAYGWGDVVVPGYGAPR